ncbi:hypothetical protein GCM10009557_82940 [Virgisporangium ochraceum]
MSPPDPHIHVDVKLHADVAVREMTAATFGLAGDLPSRATTGCGLDVPYAMTSTEPRTVTCLPCREYAHRRYLERAESAERFDQPGLDLGARAAAGYRDLARGFG